MENYLLWEPSYVESDLALSFFATEVNVQRIGHGTREMVQGMLGELEFTDLSIESWNVRRFLTNYVTEEPESEDWRDSWAETWEITMKLNRPIELKPPRLRLVRSYEHDHSWSGDRRILPAEIIVVADFRGVSETTAARDLLQGIAVTRSDSSSADRFLSKSPSQLRNLLEQARTFVSEDKHRSLSIAQRPQYSHQLLISLGVVDEGFFAADATLAKLVVQICELLDGTTTWDERYDAHLQRGEHK